ncbi:hypothetical protein [Frankia sp. CiP3]|uniref:hypothetical protein n=1 Tax=Frankia sp. CiP3 TaxID=2880971 RepID=UPI001EF5C588|nr:hypothetical protein [Frankia sp. CiP3]
MRRRPARPPFPASEFTGFRFLAREHQELAIDTPRAGKRTGSDRSGLEARLPPQPGPKGLHRTAGIGSRHANAQNTHRNRYKLGIDANPRLRLTVASAEPILACWPSGQLAGRTHRVDPTAAAGLRQEK